VRGPRYRNAEDRVVRAHIREVIRTRATYGAWRRTGRAHTGQVQRAVSNERWSSDGLEIACWNGEYVQIGFVLDCHDRECLAWVAVSPDLCAADIQQVMH
jgi:transposase InsO family protein